MLNSVILMGRLTDDPEIRSVNEYTLGKFDIAVQRDYRNSDGERPTDFFRVIAWNGLADFISGHFKKGQPIVVEGALRTRTYFSQKDGTKRHIIEVEASKAYFAGGNNSDTERDTPVNENPQEQVENGLRNSEAYKELCEQLDDDYPF